MTYQFRDSSVIVVLGICISISPEAQLLTESSYRTELLGFSCTCYCIKRFTHDQQRLNQQLAVYLCIVFSEIKSEHGIDFVRNIFK